MNIAIEACINPTFECTAAAIGLSVDLGIAVRDRDGGFLVQAEQHLRRLVPEIIHDRVVQAAKARAGIERDIRNVEIAQCFGGDVAAECGCVGADCGGVFKGFRGGYGLFAGSRHGVSSFRTSFGGGGVGLIQADHAP